MNCTTLNNKNIDLKQVPVVPDVVEAKTRYLTCRRDPAIHGDWMEPWLEYLQLRHRYNRQKIKPEAVLLTEHDYGA